jgi:Cu/Ag efflux protein CusF
MKTRLLTAAILAVSLPFLAHAQSAPQAEGVVATAPGQALAAETIQVQGKVKSIDKKKRNVVVVGEQGNEVTITVGEDARNFNQLRKGDIVTLTYAQALALELQKVSGKVVSERVESEQAVRTKLGDKPGGIVQRSIRVVAEVVVVDLKANTVTLRGPKRTVDMAVNNPAQLKEIKVGDQVEAHYIEAVAIEVSAAPRR